MQGRTDVVFMNDTDLLALTGENCVAVKEYKLKRDKV
jgi:hypothetical protein